MIDSAHHPIGRTREISFNVMKSLEEEEEMPWLAGRALLAGRQYVPAGGRSDQISGGVSKTPHHAMLSEGSALRNSCGMPAGMT